jgi:hypothetical protein
MDSMASGAGGRGARARPGGPPPRRLALVRIFANSYDVRHSVCVSAPERLKRYIPQTVLSVRVQAAGRRPDRPRTLSASSGRLAGCPRFDSRRLQRIGLDRVRADRFRGRLGRGQHDSLCGDAGHFARAPLAGGGDSRP